MSIETIKTVADFLRYIEKIKKENNCFNNEIIFRGHANSNWSLEPSIFRKENKGNEANFWNEIQLRNYDEIELCKTDFEKLTVMQHYGLPTRLLDWTYNPLVALYFSAEYSLEENGKIIILKPKKIGDSEEYYSSFEIEQMMENINIDTFIRTSDKLRKNIKSGVKYTLTPEILKKNNIEKYEELIGIYDIIEDCFDKNHSRYTEIMKIMKDGIYGYTKNVLSSIYFIAPKLTNDRLKAQNGLFSIHGNKIDGDTLIYDELTDKNIKEFTDFYDEIIVDKDSKAEILKQLEALNIHKGTIYPEIANYSQYLKEKYKNK